MLSQSNTLSQNNKENTQQNFITQQFWHHDSPNPLNDIAADVFGTDTTHSVLTQSDVGPLSSPFKSFGDAHTADTLSFVSPYKSSFKSILSPTIRLPAANFISPQHHHNSTTNGTTANGTHVHGVKRNIFDVTGEDLNGHKRTKSSANDYGDSIFDDNETTNDSSKSYNTQSAYNTADELSMISGHSFMSPQKRQLLSTNATLREYLTTSPALQSPLRHTARHARFGSPLAPHSLHNATHLTAFLTSPSSIKQAHHLHNSITSSNLNPFKPLISTPLRSNSTYGSDAAYGGSNDLSPTAITRTSVDTQRSLRNAFSNSASKSSRADHDSESDNDFDAPSAEKKGKSAAASKSASAASREPQRKRLAKGLRHFSLKVCHKVEQQQVTTYNKVADELVSDLAKQNPTTPGAQPAAAENGKAAASTTYDEKNIRRRVYDALNVLMALGIIQKAKKTITWCGLPQNVQLNIEGEHSRTGALKQAVEAKKQRLVELLIEYICMQNLITRNKVTETETNTTDTASVASGSDDKQQRAYNPFVFVRWPAGSVITYAQSDDKTSVELHSDRQAIDTTSDKLLQEMGFAAIQSYDLARLVPNELISYYPQQYVQ